MATITRAQANKLCKLVLGEEIPLRAIVQTLGTWECLLPSGAKLKISVQDGKLLYRIDGYAWDGRDERAALALLG